MRDTLHERDEAPVAETDVESSPARSRLRWPLVVVAATVLFNLVVLRAEARPVQNLNDASVHRSMVVWANERIEDGHLPLDGWYPDLALGSSRFHHYQSLPHVLGGALAAVVDSGRVLTWTTYLGMALWPIAVFAGGRLLGWGPWVSAIAAACSPLIVSEPTLGYEWGSYAWRGYGVWSQLWGMWLLPFAWGLSFRAVSEGRSYAITASVLALTIACHLLTGYLALLSLGVFAIVRWRHVLLRFGRAALVGFGSLVVAAWVVVPLLADRIWTVNDEFSRGRIYYDSFGARKILGWFVTGQLFDRGRVPVVSIVVVAGIVVALWRFRRDERTRVILGLFLLSLLLFFGRATFGGLLRVLPGSGDLFLRRFVFGVHLAGLYLAGIGAVRLGQIGLGLLRRSRTFRVRPALTTGVAIAAAVLFLSPAFGERAAWAGVGARWIGEQAIADATEGAHVTELVDLARARGSGRFFAGTRSEFGVGRKDVVGQVPMYIVLTNHDLEAVGFVRPTWSLSSPFEYRFSGTNASHLDLFAVRYLIFEADRDPPAQAVRIAARGDHVLYEVPQTSYFELVDVLPSVQADRTNLGITLSDWFRSDLPGRHAHPGVVFEGHDAPERTTDEPIAEAPGRIVAEQVDLRDGRATVTVEADRPAFVLLKASFDPRWQVTVDGVEVEPEMIAPSFVGHGVGPGEHVMRFFYEPYPRYDLLLLVGAVCLLGLAVVPRWLTRRHPTPPLGTATAPS